ncbi:MAG: SGNH/GDSL hydrolase family protein [Kofleriaceae bacterium]|nr:SGNH/GDSL hydrolase family protein [Kofleriaceae bacterium]
MELKRWQRIALKIALSLASTFVALLLAEGLFRLFADKPVLRGAWYLGTSYRILDDDTIVLRPELADPATYAHRPDRPTVVFLGDSFTEGFPFFGDEYFKHAYVGQIARALSDANVINAGQGETGTDQQVRIFEKYILPNVKPTIVVWQLYTNDIHENLNYAAFTVNDAGDALVPLDGSKHWVHTRQAIYDKAPLPKSIKHGSYLFTSLLRATERRPSIPSRYDEHWDRWSLDKIRLELARMQAHAKTHGFTLIPFVIMPGAALAARTDPAWTYNGNTQWFKGIRDVLATTPTFVDTEPTTEDLARAMQQFGVDTIYMGDDDLAPAGDKHLNAAGHWLLVQKLLPAIRAALPPPPPAPSP